MNDYHNHFFVITGAISSGKSLLLHSLEDRHFRVMKESSPLIIQDQLAIGGKALPWKNQQTYTELMLAWELRSYRDAPKQKQPVLFDCGIPDIIAYLEYRHLFVPDHFLKAAERFRYNKKVLIVPFQEELFQKDIAGQLLPEDAQKALDVTVSVYERLGYEPCFLPKENLDRHIEFVKEVLTLAL